MSDETVEIECEIVSTDNEKSLAIVDGTETMRHGKKCQKWFWIPRSLILNDDHEGAGQGDRVTLELPRWFVEKEGLV